MRMKRQSKTSAYLKSFLMATLTVIIMLTMSVGAVFAASPEGPDVFPLSDVRGAAVIETNSGVSLYAKNADKQFYPASTTKVLTAITVLENAEDLDKETTVSDAAVNGIDPSSSHIALEVGEKVTIRQLLYGLLLCSGNDCAVALAEEVGGSVSDFAKMMNKTAKKIGADNSHFVNPHGLFSKKHYTTPNDLAKIMSYCVKNDDFVKIIKTIKFVIPKTNKSKKRELWNSHRLIKYKYRHYKGVIGGKTGYIDESGFNLITYAKRKDMNLVVVCMRASSQQTIDDDTISLMNRYFKGYHLADVKKKSVPAASLKLEDKDVRGVAANDIKVVLPNGTDPDQIEKISTFSEDVKLPLEKGQTVGKVECVYNDHIVGTAELVSKKDYETAQQTMIKKAAIIGGAALLILIMIIIAANRRKRKRKRK